MLAFLVYVLAVVGAHRLWNFEEVFRAPRDRLLRWAWAKPLTCQVCNAFWIAAAFAALNCYVEHPAKTVLFQALSAYALVRAVLWSYRIGSHGEAWLKARTFPAYVPARTATKLIDNPIQVAAPAPTAEPCGTCEKKKAALIDTQQQVRGYARRVVLLTTLSNFSPNYSLASVICDHARMLSHNPSWWVEIWVHENANLDKVPADLQSNVVIRKVIPQIPWKKDQVDHAERDRLAAAVRTNLMTLGNATVITHDVIFQSSFTTFAAALHEIGALPGFAWLHVCHSAVLERPIGNAAVLLRTTLPKGHRLLCLNDAERDYLAAYYAADPASVLVCPNARDITAFGGMDVRVRQIVQQFSLADADVVQVFPVSADRLSHKGAPLLVELFAALQRRGLQGRLVLVTAAANGPKEQEALGALHALARRLGLAADTLVITSELFPDTAAEGFSQAAIRDLFSVSNLFAFPTVSEASSLVLLEAALSGALLVINSSLHTLAPLVEGNNVLSYPFGSLRSPAERPFDADSLAASIDTELMLSMTNRSKRDVLRRFSLSSIGARLRAIVESVPLSPIK